MADIMKNPKGLLLFGKLFKQFMGGKDGAPKKAMGFEMTKDMMQMMGGFTVLRLTSMMSMADVTFTKEQLLELNAQLNKIKK